MKLEPGQTAVLKAALHELDRNWQGLRGAHPVSNEAHQMLRPTGGPWAHESTAGFLYRLIENGEFEVHFERPPTKPVEKSEEEAKVWAASQRERRCTCMGMPGTNDCKIHSD